MKCLQVKELIITDFSDHEAAPLLREAVNQHLAICPACRDLEAIVRTRLMQPFEQTVIKAPADMLGNILERITKEPENVKWYQHFVPGAISLPKIALAAGLILMLAGGAKVVYQKKDVFKREAAVCVMENMKYMESLSNNEAVIENNEIEELI